MALTASVATFNSGAFAANSDVQPPGQPVIQMELAPVPLEGAEVADVIELRQHADKLTASDTFKEALVEEEGVRLRVYRDVAGYPTVGVGHLVTPSDNLRVGQKISYDRVLKLLDKDIAIAEEGVRRLVGDLPLNQHEFDALVDLVFNVGEGNVSERKSPRLNAAIAARDYDAVAAELAYHHAGGKKARGLQYRSERREQIFMNASYEDPRNNA